jgi:hypothetical protein
MIESRQRKPTRRVLGSWSSFPQIPYARATQLHRDRPSPARCCSPAAAPDPPADDRSLEAVHAATPSSAARRQPLPGSAARRSLSSVTPDPQLESLSSSLGKREHPRSHLAWLLRAVVREEGSARPLPCSTCGVFCCVEALEYC